jgi:uncharacterized protein (DUF1684 family)
MKLRVVAVVLLGMYLGSAWAQDSYTAEIRQWQKQQEKELRADGGWLTVAGLFWLHPGDSSFGSATSNEIVLPASAPPKAGVFTLKDNVVSIAVADDADVRVNGQMVRSAIVDPGEKGKAGVVTIGDLTMLSIRRGDRIGIRLKDKNSQARREFKGMKYYPIKPQYRLVADFVPAEKGATLKIPNILGQINDLPTPGYAEFTIDGKKLHLAPVTEGECGDGVTLTNRSNCRLFFIFKDLTSGHGTYPPGRFLYTGLPKDGKLVLDFNRAENPPCAWTAYATCPLPPKENALPVPVEAGEMFAGHH